MRLVIIACLAVCLQACAYYEMKEETAARKKNRPNRLQNPRLKIRYNTAPAIPIKIGLW
jgi:hypothetical protein